MTEFWKFNIHGPHGQSSMLTVTVKIEWTKWTGCGLVIIFQLFLFETPDMTQNMTQKAIFSTYICARCQRCNPFSNDAKETTITKSSFFLQKTTFSDKTHFEWKNWTEKGHAKTFEERITGLKKTTTYENDIRQKEKELAEKIQKEKVKISSKISQFLPEFVFHMKIWWNHVAKTDHNFELKRPFLLFKKAEHGHFWSKIGYV